LNGLNSLPQPIAGKTYNWPLVAHYGQDTLFRLLNPLNINMSVDVWKSLDSLSSITEKKFVDGVPTDVIEISRQLGIDIAIAIHNWSLSDGGSNTFFKTFDPNFIFPTGPSYWTPPVWGQVVSRYPLHPYWGKNRMFLNVDQTLVVPAIVSFSTDPQSDYYQLYKAVYDKNKSLTQEEKDIAYWWSDDPSEGQSFSPPGHSYNMATIVINKSNVDLITAAEVYAKTGMAVADAFVHCWKTKYTYFNERPAEYIRSYIDMSFVQYWPEPPFPGFMSGHSIQSAATATVLESIFGKSFSFVDNTNLNTQRFYPAPRTLNFTRSFNSLWDAAVEAGASRFFGGIHTQQDNLMGLEQGKKIGENINALNWKK
ncbi:MAG: vanadium-dependent haloperoxidase, partial [Chitinophagaceae bacterium]